MGPEQEAWFDSPAEGTRSACSGHHGAICAAGRARGAPPHAVQRGPGALLAKGTVILQPGQAGLRRGFVAAVLGDEWGRVVRSLHRVRSKPSGTTSHPAAAHPVPVCQVGQRLHRVLPRHPLGVSLFQDQGVVPGRLLVLTQPRVQLCLCEEE